MTTIFPLLSKISYKINPDGTLEDKEQGTFINLSLIANDHMNDSSIMTPNRFKMKSGKKLVLSPLKVTGLETPLKSPEN